MRQIFCLLVLVGCAGPDPLLDASEDAATIVDVDGGGRPFEDGGLDAGIDGGVVADEDAAVADAGVDAAVADAGTDASVAPTCGMDAVFDPVASRCIFRRRYTSGSLCPGMESLFWGNVDDQHRIQALVAPLGNGGTGLLRNAFTGSWTFQEAGTAPGGIDWASGEPSGMNQYSYLASDGLHSYFRAYTYQFCLGPVL